MNRDKFLFMCMEMQEKDHNNSDLSEIWKNVSSSSGVVEQHRLTCSFPVSSHTDVLKNGNSAYAGGNDSDRTISHLSSTVSGHHLTITFKSSH